jgi:hypothetical protein
MVPATRTGHGCEAALSKAASLKKCAQRSKPPTALQREVVETAGDMLTTLRTKSGQNRKRQAASNMRCKVVDADACNAAHKLLQHNLNLLDL